MSTKTLIIIAIVLVIAIVLFAVFYKSTPAVVGDSGTGGTGSDTGAAQPGVVPPGPSVNLNPIPPGKKLIRTDVYSKKSGAAVYEGVNDIAPIRLSGYDELIGTLTGTKYSFFATLYYTVKVPGGATRVIATSDAVLKPIYS